MSVRLVKPIQSYLNNAIRNGHEPGKLFIGNVCFCKKCGTLLTFNEYDIITSNKMGTVIYLSTSRLLMSVGGLYNSMCIKE